MRMFYLSFADASLPKGAQFLGAVIVPALSMPEAVIAAHALGINPGGEVLGHRVTDPETMGDIDIPEEFQSKLLNEDDLHRLSRWAAGIDGDTDDDEGKSGTIIVSLIDGAL